MDLLLAIHAASAALCVLLSISLFSSRALNPICARVLGGIFLMLCVQHSLAFLSFSKLWPVASLIRPCSAMMVAPAIYIYVLSALQPERLHLKQLLWHVPPTFAMAAVIVIEAWPWVTPLIIASFGFYGVAMFYRLKKGPSRNAPILFQASSLAKCWLYILVAVMVTNVLVEVVIEWELRSGVCLYDCKSLLWASMLFFFSYVASLLLVLTRAPLLEWMHELSHRPKSSTKREPTEQELGLLFDQWQQLVADKALYLSENAITVSRAARLLGVPSRQLSQAINTLYGASFSQYLNNQRVDRAKQLLCDHQLTITEVYLGAGFSTKSHFHREFTRVTQMTPSEFRVNQTNAK